MDKIQGDKREGHKKFIVHNGPGGPGPGGPGGPGGPPPGGPAPGAPVQTGG
jgi:hypothetical protein